MATTTDKILYGPADQPLVITLMSLASSATVARGSLVVDNSTDLFLDVLVSVQFKLTTGSAANDQRVYIFAYGTTGGNTYPDAVTGTDAQITLDAPHQIKAIGTVYTTTTNKTYRAGPFSVAAAFDGIMPSKWGIVIRNFSGVAFTGTAADHAAFYQGLYVQGTS